MIPIDLEQKVKSFPQRPGVYLFKDKDGHVIYVGKAKKLQTRVKNYFGKSRDERPQVQFLMRRVREIDFIVTDTEKEALLLENTLIKKHQPRYNVSLKDDKTFLSIRIGMDHASPGIAATRHPAKDGARYFGPYTSGLACREVIDEIVRYFRIRTCGDREFANRIRPCLMYDIDRCTGPCVSKLSSEEYRRQVDEAVFFLTGKRRELTRMFRARMKEASEDKRYEEAARYRDLVHGIEGMVEKQKVVRHGAGDREAVGLAIVKDQAAICVLFIRGGALTGKRVTQLGRISGDESVVLESFLMQWYTANRNIPPEIVLSHSVEGRTALEEILAERRGGSVAIKVPRKGDDVGLARLAVDNAREALKLRKDTTDALLTALEKLRGKLMLPQTPDVIECLDITNLQGRDAYGSLVTFVTGEPDKNRYRLYKIQTIDTPDDYTMMREVLTRRFRPPRLDELEQDYIRREPPDLLLVDGGKGQLNTAKKVLDELGVENVPLAAIAKGESKGRTTDDIYLVGRKNPLKFAKGAKELLLLMRIRDEAHRFGITAHRKKRTKGTTASPLESIPGIGPKKRQALMKHFGSLDKLRAATEDEIAALSGFDLKLARSIKTSLG